MSDSLITNLIGYGTVVIIFNLFWLIGDGIEHYIEIYNGTYSKWLTLFTWLYTISGLVAITIGLLNLK